MIPLGLYIHIPWCERKCPYCDFNSHQARGQLDELSYVKALLLDLEFDIEHYKRSLQGRQIDSIFIGGGTPSLFSSAAIEAILNGVSSRIPVSETVEVTLEANPGSAELEKFAEFRQAGVNRLSIGVQSFNEQHLKSLGRVHNRSNALAAAGYAKEAGFSRFNLDLMFGLPDQTLAQSISDLEQAIELGPSHLSCYQLTIEPNTLFHHNPPITPDDEKLWEMQQEIQARLKNAEFNQYEVSAYAHQQQRCLHNLNYWQFGDYLGIGAGAHAKVTAPDGTVHRHWKIKHPSSYQKAALQNTDPAGGRSEVSGTDLPFEFMLNALRLTNGFDVALFQQTTALPISVIEPVLQKHTKLELISLENNAIQLTTRGKNMIDTMLQDYLQT